MAAATDTLTWADAVDAAMKPTDLDYALDATNIIQKPPRVGTDGTLINGRVIRHRAVAAYARAHKGEEVTVEYTDPATADDGGSRLIYRTGGILTDTFVNYPRFVGLGCAGEDGILIGSTVIPVGGISAIRTADDRSVVVL